MINFQPKERKFLHIYDRRWHAQPDFFAFFMEEAK